MLNGLLRNRNPHGRNPHGILIECLPFNHIRIDPVTDRVQSTGGHRFFALTGLDLGHFDLGFVKPQHGDGMGFVRKSLAAEQAFEISDHRIQGLVDPFARELTGVVGIRKGFLD